MLKNAVNIENFCKVSQTVRSEHLDNHPLDLRLDSIAPSRHGKVSHTLRICSARESHAGMDFQVPVRRL
jgi:hypothetical protein